MKFEGFNAESQLFMPGLKSHGIWIVWASTQQCLPFKVEVVTDDALRVCKLTLYEGSSIAHELRRHDCV